MAISNTSALSGDEKEKFFALFKNSEGILNKEEFFSRSQQGQQGFAWATSLLIQAGLGKFANREGLELLKNKL